MIRIVLADDHTILREGLKQLLLASGDMTIVDEASTGSDVLRCVRDVEFDVLLLDMSMPGRSGIELIKQILQERPKLRILVLSMHAEEQYAIRAIRAGAAGYLTKDGASKQLVEAIRKVAAGGPFITPSVAEQLALSAMPQTQRSPHTSLSDREFQILKLIASGLSVSEIGIQLSVSVKTVSTHKARLMQKLGLVNHTDLVRYALAQGLIEGVQSSFQGGQ